MATGVYIHNWPLQPFSQDYGLALHATYVECVNLIYKWQDLHFKVNCEQQILEKTFSWQVYLLSEFLPEVCLEDIAEKIFLSSYFSFYA